MLLFLAITNNQSNMGLDRQRRTASQFEAESLRPVRKDFQSQLRWN